MEVLELDDGRWRIVASIRTFDLMVDRSSGDYSEEFLPVLNSRPAVPSCAAHQSAGMVRNGNLRNS